MRIGFSKVIAVMLAILSIVMPTLGVYADELIEPRGQAAGIQSGASYMIKNAVSDPSMIICIIAHELGHTFKLSHNMDNTSCSVMRDNMGHELYLESPTYYDLFTLKAKVRSEI